MAGRTTKNMTRCSSESGRRQVDCDDATRRATPSRNRKCIEGLCSWDGSIPGGIVTLESDEKRGVVCLGDYVKLFTAGGLARRRCAVSAVPVSSSKHAALVMASAEKMGAGLPTAKWQEVR